MTQPKSSWPLQWSAASENMLRVILLHLLKCGYSMLQHHIWRCTCSFIFHLHHVHFQFTLLYSNVIDLSLTKSTPMPGTRRRARSWIQTHQMSWSPNKKVMSLLKNQHVTPRQKHQILSVQEMQQLCEAEGLTLQGFRAQVPQMFHNHSQSHSHYRSIGFTLLYSISIQRLKMLLRSGCIPRLSVLAFGKTARGGTASREGSFFFVLITWRNYISGKKWKEQCLQDG